MTWSLIQAGLWSSTFLHLIATIFCGCKVPHCLAAEFACWGSTSSAFLPAMLWSVPKCQLVPGWFGCECQRVQGCAPNSRKSYLVVPLTEQQWGKEEGCMRNRMKKSTSILYNCNAMVDGGKLPWAAVCASVFLSMKSVDIQRWVRT